MSSRRRAGGAFWTVLRNPAFITQRALARAVANAANRGSVRGAELLVDIGCGSKPYQEFFDVGRYVGVDIETSGHPEENKRYDVLFDGETLPFPDASVGVVLCTQVLEHTPRPAELLREIARVLSPGATMILTAPFVWEEHEQPYDFFRFTSYGLAELLTSSGLEIEERTYSAGAFETLAQAMSVVVHRSIGHDVRIWGGVVTAILCAPIQVFGMALQRVLPDDGSLFLDSVIIARKPGRRSE